MDRIRGMAGRAGLMTLLALASLAPTRVGAQAVKFYPPEIGDRRVVLRWNKAPGDTLSPVIRRSCLDSLAVSSRDTAFCAWCARSLFGGYQIWRATSPDPESMVLLRTYALFDTSWTFRGSERVFVDPDSIAVRGCATSITSLLPCVKLEEPPIAPFNGFPYYYAITTFKSDVIKIGGGARIEETMDQDRTQGILAEAIRPSAGARTATPLLADVRVVPNPFSLTDPYRRASFAGENRVQIINLPSPATVKIYTVAGDLVRSLDNSDANDSVAWDLRNDNGEDVVGGIYVFVVSANGGSQTRSGHFIIIR